MAFQNPSHRTQPWGGKTSSGGSDSLRPPTGAPVSQASHCSRNSHRLKKSQAFTIGTHDLACIAHGATGKNHSASNSSITIPTSNAHQGQNHLSFLRISTAFLHLFPPTTLPCAPNRKNEADPSYLCHLACCRSSCHIWTNWNGPHTKIGTHQARCPRITVFPGVSCTDSACTSSDIDDFLAIYQI